MSGSKPGLPVAHAFICTSRPLSSWLNQVERWFALITNQAIRRSSFDSVTDLKRILALRWAVRDPRSRCVHLRPAGERELRRLFT